MSLEVLKNKIEQRDLVVGVIGLGYVGLPLLRSFFDAGVHVLGFDVDPKKIEMLRQGQSYLKHLGEDLVADMLTQDAARFDVTSDFGRLGEADAVLICVPTPLDKFRQPDLSYVEKTADAIAQTLRPGQLIVLESTTYPGTTRQIVGDRLITTVLKPGSDYALAFSPEREDPGRKSHNTQTIPKLVGGVDDVSGDLATQLYRLAIETVVPVPSAEVAEAAKLLENIYRAVNIAMVNEMKLVLDRMGIDIWQVIDAAATKPFGFQPFYPGPGLGGHCIPIDPFYLTHKAREVGLPTRFIELAGEVNHAMPAYVVEKTMLALNDHSKAVRGAKVLVVGLAYKPNVDDVRESPSFEIISELCKLGALVEYHDPHVPHTHSMRHYGDLAMSSVDCTAKAVAGYDAVVIATDHDACDWPMIKQQARLIVDTRGVMRRIDGPGEHVVQA